MSTEPEKETKVVEQDNEGNPVYYISLVVTFIVVAWGIIAQKNFKNVANSAFDFLVGNFGWFYLITMSLFVVYTIGLGISKYGNVKLGKPDEDPEYSTISWFAMLFSAGMGVGLVFWGVAEPLTHFVKPLGMEGGGRAAIDFALKKSYFHWGLHPWAAYAVFALALAYMRFRKDKPVLMSSVFIPLIGEEKVSGAIGKFVDILALFATVAGVATSLGMAALQMNSGFNFLFGVPQTDMVKVIIMVVITALFMISAISGLDKGIKILSNANITLGAILMVVGLVIGPTVMIMNNISTGVGAYLGSFVQDSLRVTSNKWYGWWTIFYWAWWIAWAPFVGTFIARISRGRTIREFVTGVLLAPALVGFVWFGIFGTLGTSLGIDTASKIVNNQPASTMLFSVMEHYPITDIFSFVALTLLSTFFITSADSATFVLGIMSSKGDPNPTTRRRVIWGVIQAGLALTLMLAGGLEMLQTASIVAAFPFAIVLLFAMVSILKALREEEKRGAKELTD
ncbi:choline/carnitine/betaine transport [Halobacteroides halobius DSM 5150]|uniref:Choline/carnitine/betaine transport n=1 Tax=Halobacteroides halobius (strain ATCC 35273 / DSM 5150 / MD-1) TaxID=748449 RepID=L0K9T6_HALHC|nr:BCCT family transporter [Halobacteroides halobius]AGB42077.1 choline/carnitine/betaine transport [Halobacteroides halobius DSM 5150]